MAMLVYLDDEEHLTEIFKLCFQQSDHDVTIFNDELAAIEFCQNTAPDIFFVDYRLKTMKGDEVIAQVPSTITTVIVTGDSEIQSEVKFDGLISKPFKLDQLKASVEQLINQYS